MKKLSVLFLTLLVSCTLAQAQTLQQITFTCSIFKEKTTGNNPPKGPIDPPTVYLEDYTLTFEADHHEYILYIKDEDDAVVYSTVVSTTVTEVVLPTYLAGDYEIDLVMDDWLFTGWINLN